MLGTGPGDAERHLDPNARMTAFVESAWLDRIVSARLSRYELPTHPFIDLNNAGMDVARTRVVPIERMELIDLQTQLASEGAVLRVVESLAALKDAWRTTQHVSGVRLRDASIGPIDENAFDNAKRSAAFRSSGS